MSTNLTFINVLIPHGREQNKTDDASSIKSSSQDRVSECFRETALNQKEWQATYWGSKFIKSVEPNTNARGGR